MEQEGKYRQLAQELFGTHQTPSREYYGGLGNKVYQARMTEIQDERRWKEEQEAKKLAFEQMLADLARSSALGSSGGGEGPTLAQQAEEYRRQNAPTIDTPTDKYYQNEIQKRMQMEGRSPFVYTGPNQKYLDMFPILSPKENKNVMPWEHAQMMLGR